MNTMQRGVLTLIRSGITGEHLPLPEGFDLEQARGELKRHQIAPLVCAGALNCGVDKDLPAMQYLTQTYLRALIHGEGQLAEVDRICAAFDAAGVDYMPLKGCNLKKLYPKQELRQMGDADILIHTGQYDRIRPLMPALGFTEVTESDHELIWHSPRLHLELHKRLIPSYNPDYYRYFGDGWRLAKLREGTRFSMEREDEFVYLFTHFAKHYRDGGIGCRHVIDLWVFRRAYPGLDRAKVEKELEKLTLLDFYRNVERLLDVWFEGAEEDAMSDFLTDFIFSSGSWGQAEAHNLSAGARQAGMAGSVKMGRVRRFLNLAFPGVETLKKRYPAVEKAPALLPVFWVVRIVTAVLFRRENVRRQSRNMAAATVEKIETYQQALHYVGLDFHFKE